MITIKDLKSVYENKELSWKALVVLQQLLLIADQEMVVELPDQAIFNTSGIPLGTVGFGVDELLEAGFIEKIDDLRIRIILITKKKNTIRVPYQSIVDLYHELCPMLPSVKALSPKRRTAIRSRWTTFTIWRGPGKKSGDRELIRFDDIESWRRYFTFIAKHCSFLHGKNDTGWRANFDFCIRESAMIDVMENKFVDRKR